MSGSGAFSFTATPMPTRATGLPPPAATLPSRSSCGSTSLVTITMSAWVPPASDCTSLPIGWNSSFTAGPGKVAARGSTNALAAPPDSTRISSPQAGTARTASKMKLNSLMSALARRQRDHRQPERIDRLHHVNEFVEVDRLGDIAVGVQAVGLEHVLLGFRGSEHDYGDALQLRVALDLLEHFAPVLLRQVEVEQDDVRAHRIGESALAAQELHGFHAVLHPVQVAVDLALLERLPRQALVAGVVLDQQDLDRPAALGCVIHSRLPSLLAW